VYARMHPPERALRFILFTLPLNETHNFGVLKLREFRWNDLPEAIICDIRS
jgi:hypothetical protein